MERLIFIFHKILLDTVSGVFNPLGIIPLLKCLKVLRNIKTVSCYFETRNIPFFKKVLKSMLPLFETSQFLGKK